MLGGRFCNIRLLDGCCRVHIPASHLHPLRVVLGEQVGDGGDSCLRGRFYIRLLDGCCHVYIQASHLHPLRVVLGDSVGDGGDACLRGSFPSEYLLVAWMLPYLCLGIMSPSLESGAGYIFGDGGDLCLRGRFLRMLPCLYPSVTPPSPESGPG